MSPVVSAEVLESQRQSILDAAEERFRAYGYGKTTMSEIAQDVAMSAANLYRYFENKQDLGAACAERCMGRRIEQLRQVVIQQDLTARDKLRAFIQGSLRYTLESAKQQPKLNELVAFVAGERQSVVHHSVEQERALIGEIIAFGNRTGEFDVTDVPSAAEAIKACLVLFEVPIFASLHEPDEFAQLADNVATLLLRGLERRN